MESLERAAFLTPQQRWDLLKNMVVENWQRGNAMRQEGMDAFTTTAKEVLSNAMKEKDRT